MAPSEGHALVLALALRGVQARFRQGIVKIGNLRLTDAERPQNSTYMKVAKVLKEMQIHNWDVKEPRSRRPITIVIL